MALPVLPPNLNLPPGMTIEDLLALLLRLKGAEAPPEAPSRAPSGVAAFSPQDWARQALQRRAALLALQQLQGQRRG